MPSILAIHAGKRPRPDTTVAELRAGGIMATERLDPLVTTLVEVMTNPSLVITVELSRDANPKLATFWGTPHRAVLGLTENRHRFQLIQVEPTLLPFHLAQTTGLDPRPEPPFSGSFAVSASALHTAETSAARNPDIAAAALRGAGVQQEWCDRFLGALVLRQSLWTIESVWLGRDSMRDECRLSVLDAGSDGYWRFGSSEEGIVTVSTSSFEDLMRRFAALLPRVGPTE
ncbi:MAG: hypothetical protein GY926_03175 [bacterium]|nr:hypothetical protein [bacterium]